jgi:FMN-dependent NADH-azoreductase
MSALAAGRVAATTAHTLLRIKVSTNGEESNSLKILEEFTTAYLAKFPGTTVQDRDLNSPQIPHLNRAEADAGRTPVASQTAAQQAAFALANELTNEVVGAQHIVIASPMHNWGPPSCLKAWVDRIVNCRTFYSKDEHIVNTQVTIIVSSGGPYSILDALKPFDHLRPWIKYVFVQIGAKEDNIRFINVDPTGRGAEAALARARSMIPDAVNRKVGAEL